MQNRFRQCYLFALGLVLIECAVRVNCDFERQPKVRVKQDTLVLEAAYDKNITFRLSHDSDLYFGDVNVLKEVRPLLSSKDKLNGGAPAGTGNDIETDSISIEALNTQVRTMKRDVMRLSRRLTNIQNRTFGPPQGRRYARLLGRMRRIDARLVDLDTNLELNECETDQKNPCKNGGTCFDGYKDFHCECTTGWAGKTCGDDIDECYILTGTDLGCQNNGVCINTAGSYRCICPSGFTGTHCRIRNATCDSANVAEICGHGACVPANNENGYKCLCEQGWTNNNVTMACIIDVDECALPNNPCHSGCINLLGSFECEHCPRGYIGDGIICRDLNECETNNGACSLQPKVQCINTEGSYHCGSCPLGWIGDGRTCEQAPSNSCNEANICHPSAKCEYISETVVCTCPLGFIGHGFGPDGCMTDGNATDPCADHVCKNNGTCELSGRGTFCACKPGYYGALCAQADACQVNPCQNGGTCKLLPGNRHSCVCNRGFTGKNCAIVREICGTVLHQESGNITYPSNGNHYEPYERCAWIIRTDETKVLNISFSNFDLEERDATTGECTKDWLQINDGRALTAQLFGRFCGKTLPLGGSILSSNHQIFFWFHSDNNTHGGGFTFTWTSQTHSCGGYSILNEGETGVIHSPGYPGKTPANRECEWTLYAPFGYRIVLRVYEAILGGNKNCTRDTLKIYDSDLLLRIICESTQPEPLHTSSNVAVVHLHTDSFLADSAFQLHYEVVPGMPHCGGLFSEPTGIISGYMDATICEYLIQQPPGLKVELEFTHFNLLQTEDCALQKIEIFDGKTDDAVLLKRLCGSQLLTEPLVSSSNFMLLRYEYLIVGMAVNKEFRAKYRRVCDERFIGPEGGVITTPNYPNPYFDSITCTYNIYGPSNSVVHVNFTDFSISETIPSPMGSDITNSTFDYGNYLEVYLSNNDRRVFFKTVPFSLVSEKNRLRIVFHAAVNTQKRRGMRIEYDFETIGCGGVLIENTNAFVKTGSLMNIPESCEWIIEAPAGKHIQLELSYEYYGNKCRADEANLFIYSNTSDGSSQLLGSYCGNDDRISEPVFSNIVTIILKKPLSPQRHLPFALFGEYKFLNSSTDCGGNFTARNGIIKSSNWPNSYASSMDCEWIIGAPLSHQIELVVQNFSLESTTSCADDYLEIRNGMSMDAPLIGKYCGTNIPKRIPSFTNYLYLHFHSDGYIEDTGFFMRWQQTKTGCGGKLNSHMGSIHTPVLDKAPGEAITCDWHINVAAGSTIEISIKNMLDIRDFSKQFDLTIFDGPNTQSKIIKYNCNYSGSLGPHNSMECTVKSTQNQVFIRYRNDNIKDEYIILDYKTNCNNLMPDSLYGVIETPNFPEFYPSGMSCSWDIRSARNNKISLTFSQLMLEQKSASCNLDYVELLDMRDDVILTTKRLCIQPIGDIISEGNRFLLKFSSDYSINERGFRVEYKRLGCGQHLHRKFGIFGTPNPPYSIDQDCEWYIDAPAGKQILLNFQELHIETDKLNCADNEIIVSEEKNSNITLFHECQIGRTNIKITAPANRLYIRFRTNDKRTRKYFRANYLIVDAICGGNFYAPSGSIISPNYPDKSSNVECIWDINVPESFGIIVEFTTIDCTGGASIETRIVEDTKQTVMQNACTRVLPNRIFLHTNHIAINMTTGNGQGVFALTYKRQCGGKLKLSSGFLKAEPNDNCEWELEAPDGALISLDILHLECPCTGTLACGFNISEHVPNLTCSNNVTNFIDERLFVNTLGVSFQAKFTVLENSCGGKVTSLEGILAAPLYQNTYPASIECIWEIEATKGNILELDVLFLDIAFAPHCNEDFLEIRTDHIGGKVLGVYCGTELPTDSLTALQKVWIKFKSAQGSNGGRGFKLSWTYKHEMKFNATTGTIESPPIYSARAQEVPYSWRVFVPRGNRVALSFQTYSSGLKVFDGFDDTALPVDVQFSPWRFISSSNVVFLTTSNSDLEYFILLWGAISSSAVKDNATISDCNEVITLPTNSHVNISSPGYPYGYKNNLQCGWVIKTEDPTLHPVFYLYEAILENYNDCSADYVRVSTSRDLVNWWQKEQICWTTPMNYSAKSIIHGEPYLKIEFNTDQSVNGSGFTSMLFTSCGSYMTDTVGSILDTQVLHASKWNSTCLWHISVHPGKRIRFTFDYGSEPLRKKSEHCAHYAIIYDGINDDAPILPPGQICNHPERNVQIIETTSNQAILKYNVTWNTGYKPSHLWNLTYREFSDCDEEIVLTQLSSWVNISSPRYPNVPNPHTECNWIVIAPPGETVRADFIGRFDMNVRYCNKEYIEFHDGSTTSARNLGRFCLRPNTILSTANILHVHYMTDISEPRTGFQLNVSIAICGGIYYAMRGEISSNNYPALGAYPKGTNCEYTIKLQQNSRIELNFTDIHLPFDAKNIEASDSLEVLTYEENPVRLAIYYGNLTTYSVIQLDANALIIRLRAVATDNSKYRGFQLKYNRVFGPCFREFTSSSGHISFNKMKTTSNQQLCQWRITVPKGQRVSLQLSSIQGRTVNNTVGLLFRSVNSAGLTFYNDLEMRSEITNFNASDFKESRTIRSSDNIMMVTIRMIHENYAIDRIEAFYNADESSLCPRNIGLESLSGQIELGELLASNFYCHMAIALNGAETITFAIKELQIQKNTAPITQYAMSFRNDDTFQRLGVLSRNVSKHFISLSPRRGSVVLLQNQFIHITSFSAQYYRHACGGTYQLTDDLVLEYPIINQPIKGELECLWTFRMLPGQAAYRIVGNISLTDSCEREYIVFHGGVSTAYAELARICRDTPYYNGTELQKGYTVMVYHATEYRPSQSNFRLKTDKSFKCGSKTGILSFSEPVIIDANSYKNNMECGFEFFTTPGLLLSLHFTGRFFLEESPNCTKDYLSISSFIGGLWMPETRFCGREVPRIFNASSNHIMVTFRTDDKITADGFNFMVHVHCNVFVNVTEQTQLLRMPEIEPIHRRNVRCEYTFLTESEKKINVRIKSSRNYSNDEDNWNRYCEFAWFRVLTQNNDTPEDMGQICSNTELRADNVIKLEYNAMLDAGFIIEYDLIMCGGNITAPRVIRSVQQEHENRYVDLMHCVWYITAPHDHSVVVRLKYFDMESNFECRFDYFSVYKGSSINEEKIVTKICGNLTENPPEIAVDSNQAVIVAVSDESSNFQGFLANIVFVQNCNERITLTDGNTPVTLSRQFKTNASEELLCYYRIMAPEGYRVSIHLRELQLNTRTTCAPDKCAECNHIELFDSLRSRRTSMGKYCSNGRVDIKRISSNEDALLKINGKLAGETSFEITLNMELTECGPTDTFNLRENQVTTISFPAAGRDKYPPNIHCTWRINAVNKFQIHFDSFLLQEVSQLTGECIDYLKIKGTYNTRVMCGNATGFALDFKQSGSSLNEIIFHSDESIESKGFNLTISHWFVCNKTYTDLSGEILYTNYESAIESCMDEIRVPEDYAITMYLISSSFHSYHCSSSEMNLKIIDINSNKTLREQCSNNYETAGLFTTTNAVRISASSFMELRMFYVANKKSLPPGCGGIINSDSGELKNPFYNDRNTSECRWEFIVPTPNRLHLAFYSFDMGSVTNCHLDYVKIFEVQPNGIQKLGRTLCGENLEEPSYFSQGSHIALVARKSQNFDGSGWILTFYMMEDESETSNQFVNEFP